MAQAGRQNPNVELFVVSAFLRRVDARIIVVVLLRIRVPLLENVRGFVEGCLRFHLFMRIHLRSGDKKSPIY